MQQPTRSTPALDRFLAPTAIATPGPRRAALLGADVPFLLAAAILAVELLVTLTVLIVR